MRYRIAAATGMIVLAAASAAALKLSGSPPNIELLMPFILVSGLVLGPVAGFVNALLIRGLYDLFIAFPGPWTPGTMLSYAIVGLLAGLIPMLAGGKRSFSRIQMTAIAIVLTIVYDFLTLIAFSVMFNMPILMALGPQIPFTINHVLGNALFVFAFAPLLSSVLTRVIALDKMESRAPQPAQYRL